MKRNLTALVIGNGDYNESDPLNNATNDAEDMGERLRKYGFHVEKLINATLKEMNRALLNFKKRLDVNDVGLFFFAGHGMQLDGENFLAAVDSEVAAAFAFKHSALSLNTVLSCMHEGKAVRWTPSVGQETG